jgi:acyl dehydratase
MKDLGDRLRAMIGSERRYVAPDALGAAAIRYFAIAIGDLNPLWLDEKFARESGFASVVAPPTLVCETNQFVPGPRGEDGYLSQMVDEPMPGVRQIRGGNSYEFFRRVLPTDKITITWRVSDVQEKTSSTGAQMFVTTSIAIYTNQDGAELARNTETLIYQVIQQ